MNAIDAFTRVIDRLARANASMARVHVSMAAVRQRADAGWERGAGGELESNSIIDSNQEKRRPGDDFPAFGMVEEGRKTFLSPYYQNTKSALKSRQLFFGVSGVLS